jgi:hypothetical protein
MILAAHQPNFIPRLEFFDKMSKADIFVILIHVQFEKNGFQNRANIGDKWWSCPVHSGLEPIKDKRYTNGNNLVQVNMTWIHAIALTLGINTSKIRFDFKSKVGGTARIVELCKFHKCDQYLTNPSATEKYLDERQLNDNAIELLPHKFEHRMSIFEAFNTMGIEKCQRIIHRGINR